jgi:hypothetical protein
MLECGDYRRRIMKQLFLPDDLYNTLESLATKKRQTLAVALAAWAEAEELADQDAFWGPDIAEKLTRAGAEIASRSLPAILLRRSFSPN